MEKLKQLFVKRRLFHKGTNTVFVDIVNIFKLSRLMFIRLDTVNYTDREGEIHVTLLVQLLDLIDPLVLIFRISIRNVNFNCYILEM